MGELGHFTVDELEHIGELVARYLDTESGLTRPDIEFNENLLEKIDTVLGD